MRVLSFDIGTRNLAYCLMEFQTGCEHGEPPRIVAWEAVDTVAEAGRANGKKKCTMDEHASNAVAALQRRVPSLWQPMPDVVAIERQRAGKFGRPTMVAMSHVLQTFVETRAATLGQPAPRIVFVSPTKKVHKALMPAAYDEEAALAEWHAAHPKRKRKRKDGADEARQKRGKDYDDNKSKAKARTAWLLRAWEGAEEARAVWGGADPGTHGTAADLADALLQAYALVHFDL